MDADASASQAPVLVTGAAGFIGFALARRLLEGGRAVVGIDSINDYYDPALKEARLAVLRQFNNFTFHKLDLADRASTEAIFRDGEFGPVVHLAAQAGVRYSLQNPHAYLDANLAGFLNVLEGCRHRGTPHLVFASSSSVYGANTHLPFSVHDNVDHPISLYAATKKANELMAHAYSHLYGLPDHRIAILHRVRSVGPPRHGDVHLCQGDCRRPADPIVQPRPHAPRLHLRR